VSAQGKFNVPFGRPESDFILDSENLRACAEVLGKSGVHIFASDFERNLSHAESGDLVYLDPPYVTSHTENGFIEYNEVLFSWEDQLRLASLAVLLARKGVHVIVTNAFHPKVIELYEGFQVRRISRYSTLAGTMENRRRVSEALLFSLAERS
jgi:DNA adenine methylase